MPEDRKGYNLKDLGVGPCFKCRWWRVNPKKKTNSPKTTEGNCRLNPDIVRSYASNWCSKWKPLPETEKDKPKSLNEEMFGTPGEEGDW